MKCHIFKTILLLAILLIWALLAQAEEKPQTRMFGSQRDFQLKKQLPLHDLAFDKAQAVPSSTGIKDSRSPRKISREGALLRSLLVPGWGESYLGYHKTARAFFWVDMAIWTTVAGLHFYGQWREDQFRSYAAAHSGAIMAGKSDKYYADIGNYNSTDEYNQAKLLTRNYDALYTDPAYFWAWDDEGNRLEYDQIRIQSRSAKNRVYFFVGAAALNRLISVVDTGKKATDLLKKKKTAQLGFQVQPGYANNSNEIHLVLTADF